MKTCTKCGWTIPFVSFYKNKSAKDGLNWQCKQCADAYALAYRKSPQGRKMRARQEKSRAQKPAHKKKEQVRNAKRRQDQPQRARAHNAINNRIKRGDITRQPCEDCGSTHRIEAHHYLGYAEEHHLDIQWLCKKHHMEADAKMGEVANDRS